MTQQAIFFEGTLRENLIYGLPYVPSDEQLVFALKNALLYTELQGKCLDVLEYPVAEHASNFSGGQKQRIAIARAFLRQPKWFFADESTANLDEKTEEKVLTNLENYASTLGAGIVYTSHSEKVMARCHEIKNMKQAVKAA
jgi:ABC-type multidrug transport system fused ATPase/permease subunit